MTGMIVQSVIIDKNLNTLKQATDWILKHKYKVYKIDETINFYRFRQVQPDYNRHFITKLIDPHKMIYLIVEY